MRTFFYPTLEPYWHFDAKPIFQITRCKYKVMSYNWDLRAQFHWIRRQITMRTWKRVFYNCSKAVAPRSISKKNKLMFEIFVRLMGIWQSSSSKCLFKILFTTVPQQIFALSWNLFRFTPLHTFWLCFSSEYLPHILFIS